jgi:hypothetical protein
MEHRLRFSIHEIPTFVEALKKTGASPWHQRRPFRPCRLRGGRGPWRRFFTKILELGTSAGLKAKLRSCGVDTRVLRVPSRVLDGATSLTGRVSCTANEWAPPQSRPTLRKS